MKQRRSTHAFVYRDGIGLVGTSITCDGPGFANDLVFLSHAHALPQRRAIMLAGARAGRRQVVTTETTLRLLGKIGDRLKPRTLPAVFGRPFNLGRHRIEVVPTGFLPGAAGLLCETEGRRLFYVGAMCPEVFTDGVEPAEVRSARAVCLDASFAVPGLRLPPRAQTMAEVCGFADDCLRAGESPMLLGAPTGALPWIALALARAGLGLRAHARVASAIASLGGVCEAMPAVARFAGKLGEREVLLWPADARATFALQWSRRVRRALISGYAADPAALDKAQAERGFPFTPLATFDELLAFTEATAAREVALFHASGEEILTPLRARGLDAYILGPPRQMTLPGA
jgi:hypothetical protein